VLLPSSADREEVALNPIECQRRDTVLRVYFAGRSWDDVGEFALKRRVVLESLLPDYPYVIDDEWDVEPGHPNHGRGDLLFSDGAGRFAVVEVKYVDLIGLNRDSRNRRNSNRKKRRKVEEQAMTYAREFARQQGAGAEIATYIYTNDRDEPVLLGRYAGGEGAATAARPYSM
jgi:hypothetical protein